MNKPKILECNFVRGKRINYIYALFEGAELNVIGTTFSNEIQEDETNDFIGLTGTQAEKLFAKKIAAHA